MSAEEKGIPGDPMQRMNWLRPNLWQSALCQEQTLA